MHVYGVFPNRDERTLVRTLLGKFSTIGLVTNLREGLRELEKAKQVDFLIVDDTAGDRAVRRPWSDETEKDLSTFEFLEAVNAMPFEPLILVLCSETASTDDMLHLTELGVDLFLRRPFATKELDERIQEGWEKLCIPPQELKVLRELRRNVKAGRHREVRSVLEKLCESAPDDVRFVNLLSQALISSGEPQSVERARHMLEKLEERMPQSLSVKRKLYGIYEKSGPIEFAFDKCLELFVHSPSEPALNLARDLAGRLADSRKVGARPFLRLMQRLLEMPDTRRTQSAMQEVVGQLLERVYDSQQLFQFVEAVEELDDERAARLTVGLPSVLDRIGDIDEFTYLKTAQLLQRVNPGEPQTIERLVDLLLAQGDTSAAEQVVGHAKNKKNFSPNFYVAATRLALAQGYLKEASDMLHSGRKSRPSDDRWDELAQRWKRQFDEAAQKKQV